MENQPTQNQVQTSLATPDQQTSNQPSNTPLVILFSLVILVLIGLSGFLFYQNQQLKNMLAGYQIPTPDFTPVPVYTPIESASPSATMNANPVVSSPKTGSKVVSPLKITGTVPAGWVSEGTFPIQLVDSNRNLIAQGSAKEVTPGSWQSGKPVNFSVVLPFSTTDSSGTLILSNDNPSGDPAKAKFFEVPVNF